MLEDTHPHYDFYQLMFSNADTGHAGSRRDRTYVIGAHSSKTTCRHDPYQLKDAIANRMRKKVATVPSDYFFADTFEVQQDAMQVAARRRIPYRPGEQDLQYLLTPAEQERLRLYKKAFKAEYGQEADQDENLVCFLGDDPRSWRTWSATSNAIPTMRRNAKTGLLFSPYHKRWLVPSEKLGAMSWPVNDSMASAMNCPVVPTRDILRAADLAGNAMSFTTVAVAQLIALSCFAPLSQPVV